MTGPALPVYEVPAFVLERYSTFRPDDPSTWPEPDRCTDGRPWGFDAYGALPSRDLAYRWENYLAGRGRLCRNRWKNERYRLCGIHVRPFLDRLAEIDRAGRIRAATERHLDLAKRLAAHGIEADGRSSGVVLQADAAEALLDRLALLAGAIPHSSFPTTDTTVPPPL